MGFESILGRWNTAEEGIRLAEDEVVAAMKQFRVGGSGDARLRIERALEQRDRARRAVLAVVFEVERGVLNIALRYV
jgi:hypothetical protein